MNKILIISNECIFYLGYVKKLFSAARRNYKYTIKFVSDQDPDVSAEIYLLSKEEADFIYNKFINCIMQSQTVFNVPEIIKLMKETEEMRKNNGREDINNKDG